MNEHLDAIHHHKQQHADAQHAKEVAIAEHHQKQTEMTSHLEARATDHDARVEEHKAVADHHMNENEILQEQVPFPHLNVVL